MEGGEEGRLPPVPVRLLPIPVRVLVMDACPSCSYLPTLPTLVPRSDEYKPAYISAAAAIAYVNVDGRALVNNPPADTGASRYFNFLDADGSATLRWGGDDVSWRHAYHTYGCRKVAAKQSPPPPTPRGKPTLVASWPSWWNLGPDCAWQPLGHVYW